jgi:hypothetical protein
MVVLIEDLEVLKRHFGGRVLNHSVSIVCRRGGDVRI